MADRDHLWVNTVEEALKLKEISSVHVKGHLWINDSDRIVCTHCGLDLKDHKGGPIMGTAPLQEPVQKLLRSLEPDEVDGYTISTGHAFDGVTLHGFYQTFDDVLEAVEAEYRSHEDWHIVPIWKP
jgi:hypothetical protein